ncbi:hypothetical protein ACCS54_19535 [Rhizobium johnstonii]|uniref:hypothetical protein n=1 Tax=Rhizobium johnstonii TaxID=3019933 RepID=UPI003F99EFC5
MLSHDIEKGDRFRITTGRKNKTFEVIFKKQRADGALVFRHVGRREPWYSDLADFFRMWQFENTAIRLVEIDQDGGFTELMPETFEPIDFDRDSPAVQARKRNYQKAVTQHYYIRLHDLLNLNSSVPAFRKLVNSKKPEHKPLGLYDIGIGGSTLVKLCRECGTKGDRPLEAFLDGPRGGDQRSGKWEQIILKAKAAMLARYYSAAAPERPDVISEFKKTVAAEAKKLPLIERGFARPSYNTLVYWIRRAETDVGLALREGRQVQNRQIGGIHPMEPTFRPLQTVVLDHTQIDMNIVVYNKEGTVIERIVRPYLIVVVDVHTRMILAARLSLEHPSLHTLYAGLKEALRPKIFTNAIKSEGVYDISRDGFGKFRRMLVDNGLENIGRSLQMSARAVGLHVSFAPIRTGEYKAVAERLFNSLNTRLWHLALGGVKTKPGDPRPFDPRTKAEFTLSEAQYILWRYIIEVYHLQNHDGIDMQPALKWQASWGTWKRPLIDDMGRIEKVFGRYVIRQLTTSGIQYGNQVFHDPEIVSSLLADLLYVARKRRGHKGKHQSVSVAVETTVFDDDVSHIVVFNPVRQTYVRIPNRDKFAAGSYEEQRDIDLENYRRREEFFSEDDLAINYDDTVAIVTGRNEFPDDLHSSAHSIPADGTEHNIIARSPKRGKGKSASKKSSPSGKPAAPGRLTTAVKTRASSHSIPPADTTDASENVQDLIELAPRQDPAPEAISDLRERIRAQVRQSMTK